jgi:hypothetical protein
VAGLATHGLVCSTKLKAGAHVVKSSAWLLRMRQIESAKKCHHKGKPGPCQCSHLLRVPDADLIGGAAMTPQD